MFIRDSNRAGRRDVPDPVTDTNVYLMTSKDGRDWDGPFGVATGPTDQWFPWLEVNPRNGRLGVVYHERVGADRYVTRLATGRRGDFDRTLLSGERSFPNDSLFFQAGTPECPKCATFHGDYNGIDYGADGAANVVWTDMRRVVTADGETGHTENIFFTRLP
jgi:hypothetical protein